MKKFALLLSEDGRREVDKLADCSVHSGGARGWRGRPIRQPDEIVWPAGLGASPDGRPFPTTERLTAHDRASDAAVDIKVAGLGPAQPEGNLVPVKRMQPGCQAKVDLVLQLYRLGQVHGGHEPKNWAEILGQMELRPARYAGLDAR